jgi:hypothetical protein
MIVLGVLVIVLSSLFSFGAPTLIALSPQSIPQEILATLCPAGTTLQISSGRSQQQGRASATAFGSSCVDSAGVAVPNKDPLREVNSLAVPVGIVGGTLGFVLIFFGALGRVKKTMTSAFGTGGAMGGFGGARPGGVRIMVNGQPLQTGQQADLTPDQQARMDQAMRQLEQMGMGGVAGQIRQTMQQDPNSAQVATFDSTTTQDSAAHAWVKRLESDGTAASAGANAGDESTLKDRLRELDDARAAGLLTTEEYQKAREKIINSL